jgi:hypothetical protein
VEKENTQAIMEISGGLAFPFTGEILADETFTPEYHDTYVYSFHISFQGYLLNVCENSSDDKKIRHQQLVDLYSRFKLTSSGNMGFLRVSLRSFSGARAL